MLESYPGHLFRPEKKTKALLDQPGKSWRRETTYLQKTVAGPQRNITSHCTVAKQSSILANRKRKQKQLSQRFAANPEHNKIKNARFTVHCTQICWRTSSQKVRTRGLWD